MFYWIKIIHVVSAALLLGVGMATAIYYIYLHHERDLSDMLAVNKQLGYADWFFTAIAGVIQPMTGFTLIYLRHYPVTVTWWLVVIVGFGLAGICWFPAVYLRHQCLQLIEVSITAHRLLSSNYYSYYRWRCALSMMAFLILIIVFYFMANVPQPM